MPVLLPTLGQSHHAEVRFTVPNGAMQVLLPMLGQSQHGQNEDSLSIGENYFIGSMITKKFGWVPGCKAIADAIDRPAGTTMHANERKGVEN